MQVELHPADDEEDRHQETEPDGLELTLDDLGVLPADEQADHDAGRERPEQDVEAELEGKQDQPDDEQHRHPDRQLSAGVHVLVQEADHRRGMRAGRERGRRDRRDDEHEQQGGRDLGVAAVQDHPDDQDGGELADAADRHQPGPEAPLGQAGVAHDREQCPQRRGGEGQADHYLVDDRPDQHQRGGDRHGQDQRDDPSADRQLERPSADPREVELETGQEHQERQAH